MTDYRHLFTYDDPIVERVLRHRASAFANDEFINITTTSDHGLSVDDHLAPEHVLMPDVSDAQLGHSLLSSLSLSRLIDFDDPDYTNEKRYERYQRWVKEMMARFGYKTKGALFKKMNNCDATIDGNILIISPTYHDRLEGWSGDLLTDADDVRIPADSSSEEVGAALRLAFSRCKTKGFGSVSLKKKPKKSDGA